MVGNDSIKNEEYIMNLFTRLLSTAAIGYIMSSNVSETLSPLVSGPVAAQQLSDSNVAYVGTQFVASNFNGSGGFGLLGFAVFTVALVAIWYKPVSNLFKKEA
jgi:hypothetical protein